MTEEQRMEEIRKEKVGNNLEYVSDPEEDGDEGFEEELEEDDYEESEDELHVLSEFEDLYAEWNENNKKNNTIREDLIEEELSRFFHDKGKIYTKQELSDEFIDGLFKDYIASSMVENYYDWYDYRSDVPDDLSDIMYGRVQVTEDEKRKALLEYEKFLNEIEEKRLTFNNWQDGYWCGAWDMTQEEVDDLAKSTLREVKEEFPNSTERTRFWKGERSASLFIYGRDIHPYEDYKISLTKKGFPNLRITWYGHSCFKIENDDYSLIIDPYMKDSVPGLYTVDMEANAVYCTHEHSDHNGRSEVKIINSEMASPFTVKTIDTYHDDVQGAERGKNKIYIIDDGVNRVAHLGDLGCELTPEQMKELENFDCLMIPVGGYYTIDGKQAADLVHRLNPRMVIPMHYRDDERKFGYSRLDTVENFTKYMDSLMTIPASIVNMSSELTAQVIVMPPVCARHKHDDEYEDEDE